MFHKELLLIGGSKKSDGTYQLQVGHQHNLAEETSIENFGFWTIQQMGSISPTTFLGSTLACVALTVLEYGRGAYLSMAVEVSSKGLARMPIYVGFLKKQEYTVRLPPSNAYPASSGWGREFTEGSSAMRKAFMNIRDFLSTAIDSTIPIYLSTTPPAWGYTE